ncbi:MarR family transcriptional regulator [Phycicoccus sp.]|uniref:GbsR/MarR family transcriptional regulator n=1 Tax=Phycicoccus sp. TaxID=1902410 RepID=UPI002B9ADA10|nr:MarR family transcriptional regulator [Phycicoccus sp.]HMM93643.1 transcriptional regulator TrmB [Phycicoccus sp.]
MTVPSLPGSPDPPADVVERLGGALAEVGIPLQPARVFAALLATEDGRRTSAQLVDLLDISPAAVSGAVRYLSQVRMIRRERERGSRRDVYVALDDAWHDMMMQTDQLYAPILAALVAARDNVGPGTRAGQRMQLSAEFLEFIQREMDAVAHRWEEYKSTRSAPAHPAPAPTPRG